MPTTSFNPFRTALVWLSEGLKKGTVRGWEGSRGLIPICIAVGAMSSASREIRLGASLVRTVGLFLLSSGCLLGQLSREGYMYDTSWLQRLYSSEGRPALNRG